MGDTCGCRRRATILLVVLVVVTTLWHWRKLKAVGNGV